MTTEGLLAGARWRTSSFSGGGGAGNGDCVEAAHLPNSTVAVRDSKSPGSGVILFARSEMSAWINRIKSGQFD